jgi:hypothetical protein
VDAAGQPAVIRSMSVAVPITQLVTDAFRIHFVCRSPIWTPPESFRFELGVYRVAVSPMNFSLIAVLFDKCLPRVISACNRKQRYHCPPPRRLGISTPCATND